MEQYTGEGEPPYCEMTLRATEEWSDPYTIYIDGIRNPNSLKITRVAEADSGESLSISMHAGTVYMIV